MKKLLFNILLSKKQEVFLANGKYIKYIILKVFSLLGKQSP